MRTPLRAASCFVVGACLAAGAAWAQLVIIVVYVSPVGLSI